MSNRSYLETPEDTFEMNDSIAVGWLFLFKKSQVDHNFQRYLIEKEERVDEEKTEEDMFEFKTTVKEALGLMETRLAAIRLPYLKNLLRHLEPLTDNLKRSPSEGEVKLDCAEFALLGDEKTIGLIEELPDKLEEALKKMDYKDFAEVLGVCLPLDLTGNVEKDAENAEALDMTLEEALIGFRG